MVAPVPGGVSVEIVVVVNDRSTMPVASPCSPSPTSAARQSAEGNSRAEPDNSSCGDITCTVPGSDVRIAVNRCWIVLGNVHDLRIRGLNHDGLRRLVHDFNL